MVSSSGDCSDGLEMVTLTPGKTAPLSSVTFPSSPDVFVAVCPCAGILPPAQHKSVSTPSAADACSLRPIMMCLLKAPALEVERAEPWARGLTTADCPQEKHQDPLNYSRGPAGREIGRFSGRDLLTQQRLSCA